MAEKRRHHHHHDHASGSDSGGDDDLVAPRKVTGKELSETEELSARITTLVEMLDEKGILNKSEY
ncbi:MAG: hypothetical protein M3239_04990, partial [Thermoproteota archaeon]|nr:hypothetical protein [Thermoproteota archaeon]